jgi:hypothetical protein
VAPHLVAEFGDAIVIDECVDEDHESAPGIHLVRSGVRKAARPDVARFSEATSTRGER